MLCRWGTIPYTRHRIPPPTPPGYAQRQQFPFLLQTADADRKTAVWRDMQTAWSALQEHREYQREHREACPAYLRSFYPDRTGSCQRWRFLPRLHLTSSHRAGQTNCQCCHLQNRRQSRYHSLLRHRSLLRHQSLNRSPLFRRRQNLNRSHPRYQRPTRHHRPLTPGDDHSMSRCTTEQTCHSATRIELRRRPTPDTG